jgi:integrase
MMELRWTRKKKGSNLTGRLVDMTDRCFSALKKAQWNRNPHSPYVFTNPMMSRKYPEEPSRWKYDYRDKFFDRLCRLAGVREMGYHSLRHQRASQMLELGQTLVYIKEQLGHEDISTTSKYLQSLGFKT